MEETTNHLSEGACLEGSALLGLFDALRDAVIVADGEGRLTYASGRALGLCALPAAAAFGQPAASALRYRDDGDCPPFGFLTSGKPVAEAHRLLEMGDRALVPVRVAQVLLPGSGGAEILTEERAERDLAELRSDLGSTLNHDLRAGVSAAMLAMDAALSLHGQSLPPRAVDFLHRAHDSCNKAIWLVSDAHDLTRLEAGLVGLRRETTRLGPVVEEGVQPVRVDARGAEIELSLALHDPNCAFEADHDRATRLVFNLADMSVTAAARRSRVELRSDRLPSGEVCLSLRFTPSNGVPPHVERLFDRYRSPELRRAVRALGSPCAISFCRVVAEAHGWRLWSEPSDTEIRYHVAFPAL